jgi:hypothetical protein
MTYLECKKRDGIFTGIGEECSEINCDCFKYADSDPTSIGCGESLTFEGAGAKFTEKIIDLGELEFNSGNANICFRYQPYTIKDRFLVLATKSGNNENETNNFRKAPAANYYNNYLNFIHNSSLFHPRFFVVDNADGVNHNSTLWDSGCTGNTTPTSGSKTVTIPITSENVEIVDTASDWYKKLRLWILAGCAAGQQYNQTRWVVGITCDICTATSPSTALPEQNGNNSSTKSINTTQGTFTIIG